MSRLSFLFLALCLLAGCGPVSQPTGTEPVPAITGTQPVAPSPTGPTPTLAVIDMPPTSTPVVMTATAGGTPFAVGAEAVVSGQLLSNLVGRPVQTPEGHSLGTLAGLVLERNPPRPTPGNEPMSALVLYGLLAASENLGLEDRPYLPVPWQLFSIARYGAETSSKQTMALSLVVEPAVLSAAPAYAPNELPDVSMPGWDAPVVAYWTEKGVGMPVTGEISATPTVMAPTQTATAQPAAEGTPTLDITAPAGTPMPDITAENAATPTPGANEPTAVPAAPNTSPLIVRGKLASLRLASPSGDSLGTVEDLILDPVNGQIAYTILWLQDRLVVVPMTHIEWIAPPGDHAPGALYLQVPGETLQNAPGFQSVEELTNSPDWDETVQAYWSAIPAP